ncbi:MAG: DegT/DnrJ/EryC1/StrS family aminotransferase, partial [Prevotella sp.]
KYVKEAFDTNWVVPMGPNVNAFEHDIEEFVNLDLNLNVNLGRKVVCLSAGTAAVHLALLACGVGQGDEVIVQSFTFCASSHPITYLGATPVFVDSEPTTWNMDPELLEKAIVDRKEKTGKYPKAIVPVALYGMPYQIDKIMAIADKYGIPVVEDAAEGMGSRFNGQVLGTFGKFGVLSFNGNKMITTSGGGALICNDDVAEIKELKDERIKVRTAQENAEMVMWYATQARDAYPYYEHTAIGYNYRMSNVCAGIGRGQMTVLNDHIAHHKHVQSLYKELLKDVKGITLHEQPADPRYDSNFWLCAATIDPEVRIKGQEDAYKEVIKTAVGGAAGVIKAVDSATTDCQPNENVEALRVFMLQKKVECRPVWKPMHCQPVYRNGAVVSEVSEGLKVSEGPNMVAYINGVSEAIFKVGFCLPAGPYVSDDDVRYIVNCIKEAIVS